MPRDIAGGSRMEKKRWEHKGDTFTHASAAPGAAVAVLKME